MQLEVNSDKQIIRSVLLVSIEEEIAEHGDVISN